MQLTVVDTNGPLFVLDEAAEVTNFFATHYPQFAKRSLGWQLSVEEVHFLLLLQQKKPLAANSAAAANTEQPDVTVTFASGNAAEQYDALQATYATDCTVYACLTQDHGFRLRHGSAFGASYIGYRDLARHGECLFFTGPLADLEVVRAVRVARSVGKEAVMVALTADGASVTLTPLGAQRAKEAGRPRKLQRQE